MYDDTLQHLFYGNPMVSAIRGLLVGFVASWIALLFHELGHALAARMVGVRIWGIRLGMGPTVWSGTVQGTRLHLALFPLLGGVHLLDEDASAIGYRDIAPGR